jgi:hypothetical protein
MRGLSGGSNKEKGQDLKLYKKEVIGQLKNMEKQKGYSEKIGYSL